MGLCSNGKGLVGFGCWLFIRLEPYLEKERRGEIRKRVTLSTLF